MLGNQQTDRHNSRFGKWPCDSLIAAAWGNGMDDGGGIGMAGMGREVLGVGTVVGQCMSPLHAHSPAAFVLGCRSSLLLLLLLLLMMMIPRQFETGIFWVSRGQGQLIDRASRGYTRG